MDRVEQNKIGQANRQIRHSEVLAEESITIKEEMLCANAKRKSFFSLPVAPFSPPRQAFTLAEVLITLGIIGVVAAMTIPTLVSNYQKTQYVTALKKAYTQMSQVLIQMAADNGTPDSIADYFGSDATITGDAISSYYKVSKNCKMTVGKGCFAVFNDNYDGSSGQTFDRDNEGWSYKFITVDGTGIAINSNSDNCKFNAGFSAAPDAPTYNSTCAYVWIDVNGLKKPNNLGRDVFIFMITSNKSPILYPGGGFYHSNSNTGTLSNGANLYWGSQNGCSSTLTGGYRWGLMCTAKIIDNGWKMDY